MKVLVWGLGYVGSITAACLAKLGHQVTGIDLNPRKVALAQQGKSSVKEPGLDALLRSALQKQRFWAVGQGKELVADSDGSLICVGTPSAPDGSLVLSHLEAIAQDIGEGLTRSSSYHVVAVRSTVFPGTVRQVILPLLEKYSKRKCGLDFGLASNPEFLREATGIADFESPPYTIIGQFDRRSGDLVEQLYHGLSAPVHRVEIEEAELLKLTNNAFHALKIGFANEIGRICQHLEQDSQRIMHLVCSDRKLNISERYLTPGFAFGGSCLPKDLRAFGFHARRLGAQIPILDAILVSNQLQIEEAHMKVRQLGVQHVCLLGLSFKPNTDDLRESPTILLIQALWKDGIDIAVFDPDIQLDEMIGGNREYMERQLPQIGKILKDSAEEALRGAQAIIVSQKRPEFLELIKNTELPVLDTGVAVITSEPAILGLENQRS